MAKSLDEIYQETNSKRSLDDLYKEAHNEATQKPGFFGAVRDGMQRVRDQRSKREDLLKKAFTTPLDPKTDGLYTGVPNLLYALGGLRQHVEDIIARPITDAQEVSSQGGQINHQGFAELGDIARNAGVPEMISALGGLAASGAVPDPTTKLISGVRGGTYASSVKDTTANLKNLKSGSMRIFLDKDPGEVKRLIDSDFSIATKNSLRPKQAATQEVAQKIIEDVNKHGYVPAQTAFENLRKDADKRIVPNDTIVAMSHDLQEHLADEFDQHTASLLITQFKSAFEGKFKEGIPITLQDVLAYQRGLKTLAKTNVPAIKAVDSVSRQLAQAPGFADVADAAHKWNLYSRMRQAEKTLFGGEVKNAGGGLTNVAGVEMIPKQTFAKNPEKLAKFFKQNPHYQQDAHDLHNMLDYASNGKVNDTFNRIADTAATSDLSSWRPKLTSVVTYAGGVGLAGAKAGVEPRIMAGLLGAVVGESIPRASAITGKLVFQGLKKAKELPNTPLGKNLERIQNLIVDPGIQRQVTGRND